MRKVVVVGVVVLSLRLSAQQSCFPFILEPCDGDPQLLECVKVTTSLSSTEGGTPATIGQELCFRAESPLFGGFDEDLGIDVSADKGTLKLDTLKEGDQVGGFRFSVNLSEFGEECNEGDEASLTAPVTVTVLHETFVEVEVRITEPSAPLISCLLVYDPTDEEHNSGLMLQGELMPGTGGNGFVLFLHLAELEQNATFPGLEYGDLQGVASPVPLFFDPITNEGLFVLPASGGPLTVLTALSASNLAGEPVSVDFEEVFDITPGTVPTAFRRGDVNDDGKVDIADAISLLGHLFASKPPPVCPDSGDGNDDGQLNIADAISILSYLFSSGTLPDPGAETCGPDPSADTLPECTTTQC